MDALMLARIQFAANITFHILFPSISIGMCWVLLFFKLRFNKTGDDKWMAAYRFWVKIFALTFALGVVSGITMSFQFGTNWPGFMKTVGNIAGPLLAYEVLTAFFLEATFLGIMLFGFNRVSNKVHTMATILVAGGTTLSAFWIIALNSWMHTPAGFVMINGQAHPMDWLAIIFNPSFPYRFVHMLLASGLTVSFLVAGISAYRWLRKDRSNAVLAALQTGVTMAALLIPLQILMGDAHGLNTLEHQPAKIAAIEGIWHTEEGAPLLLFGIPNAKEQRNDYALGIPKAASLILRHDANATLKGLNEFEGKHPPVMPLFWGFRVMVGVGMLMLASSWLALWQLRRKGLQNWMARALVGMTFSGWLATVAGWMVTEIGRQPYLVYGVLTTADAASDVAAPLIQMSLTMYLLLYAMLISAYISVVFYLARKGQEESHTDLEKQPDLSGRTQFGVV
ncbi:cytochrome ubiquinol oxidase subunit I [Ampullimonas aquatilis]|uniref:cytochrome ubiquinol oxidase subunit I n=1 Tax=Ampullimonas aquatilis TaxID=1341549 RepID=UPI003C753480